MGTSIHAFVEIDYFGEGEPFGIDHDIRPFNGGEFFIWRNYNLYNALGDGRNFSLNKEDIDKRALFPPRGLPLHYSYAIENRFFHVVDDDGYEESFEPSLRTISNAEAENWLSQGWSVLGPPLKIYRGKGEEELRRVSSPDWHSASWLTLAEIHESLAHFGLNVGDLGLDFRAILRTMQMFENELGDGRTRLVFWFDN